MKLKVKLSVCTLRSHAGEEWRYSSALVTEETLSSRSGTFTIKQRTPHHVTYWIVYGVCPRSGLDALKKIKFFSLRRGLKQNSCLVQPIVDSLCSLSYPDSFPVDFRNTSRRMWPKYLSVTHYGCVPDCSNSFLLIILLYDAMYDK